ncbi:SMI1/KNR4 family protein [Xanthomonas medicagonis]|uniref:SMI1/KNR4 family protein n=1 Tax=Xanthomonas medicagonis TaxID=3160841 RepID=UPI00351775F5
MTKAIDCVSGVWHRRPPAHEAAIAQLERTLALAFPPDYRAFLRWSNGGEGRVGTAYFSFWPVEDIRARNVSAGIAKSLSARFVGIGSNGGGECYALDYTAGAASPVFSVVPLGDLDPASVFAIAPTLSDALEKARCGAFSDAEYNANASGPLTEQMRALQAKNVLLKAEACWQAKDYGGYLAWMRRPGVEPTPVSMKRMEIARKQVAASNGMP